MKQFRAAMVGGFPITLDGRTIHGPLNLLLPHSRRHDDTFVKPSVGLRHFLAEQVHPSERKAAAVFWAIVQPHGLTLAEYNRRATGRYK